MFRCLSVAFPLEFSLFVKLLAIPALSHDDYAAAQRVEIVASQKYSVVLEAILEATCNLLFGIKYDVVLRFLCFTKGVCMQ
ncbi:unnamed protein product [Sphagnum tenellum]